MSVLIFLAKFVAGMFRPRRRACPACEKGWMGPLRCVYCGGKGEL